MMPPLPYGVPILRACIEISGLGYPAGYRSEMLASVLSLWYNFCMSRSVERCFFIPLNNPIFVVKRPQRKAGHRRRSRQFTNTLWPFCVSRLGKSGSGVARPGETVLGDARYGWAGIIFMARLDKMRHGTAKASFGVTGLGGA